MTTTRNLIFTGTQHTANGAGVHCPVHVYEYPDWPNRYEVFVGGGRVAMLKTLKGAIRRAEREVAQ